MSKPDNRLLFFALALLVAAVFFSCTQPDDVVKAAGQTVLNLNVVERLPAPPDSLCYELWVSKEIVRDTALNPADIVSLGKFSYVVSDTLVAFLEPVYGADSLREDTNQFILEGDLFDYRSMFVSVEAIDDPDLSKPGPIMLIDNIVAREDFKPTLTFPLSTELWGTTVRYNLEAVSDNNRNSNDYHGVWFSSYRVTQDTIPDTTALDTINYPWIIDTIIPAINDAGETTNLDSLYALRLFTVTNIQVRTEKILYGPDTLMLGIDSFMHTFVTFDRESLADSTYPFTKRTLHPNAFQVGGPRVVTYDIFSQDEFDLPDYSTWGWWYEGWAVSPYIPKATTAPFTPPAWIYISSQQSWISGDSGGVISTGIFNMIDSSDNSDRFTYLTWAGVLEVYDTVSLLPLEIDTIQDTIYKKPRYPGEDFLVSDSLQLYYGVTSVNLMPAAEDGNIKGSVFISMEPANRKTTKTNFPLIAFVGELPVSANALFNNYQNPGVVDMIGKHSSVPGNSLDGFPQIRVTFNRL